MGNQKDRKIIRIIYTIACTVQLNFKLTCAWTRLMSFPMIFMRYSWASCISFYVIHEHTRAIKLLSNLFTSKFSNCQFCHGHEHNSVEIFLDTTLTYICIVHVSFVQCESSSIKNNYYLNSYPITVGIFLDLNATTASKLNNTHILLPSQNIRTYSEHVLHICHWLILHMYVSSGTRI